MAFDNKGVEYQTNEFKILVQAPQNLEFYTIPKSCEQILGGSKDSDSPFYLCASSINTIDFEKGSNLVSIGKNSFAALKGLKTVDFHNCDKLLSISERAFIYCASLNNVTLPPNLQSFGSYCFYGCKGLKNITIPDSVTNLAFQMLESTGITTVNVSRNSNIKYISSQALCRNQLKSFFIPKNVSQIDGSTFISCKSLKEITIHEENPNYFIQGKCLYTTKEKTLVLTWESSDLIVPSDVTQLGIYCFCCPNLKSVNFSGQTMKSISKYFCFYCVFPEFRFPKGIKNVPNNGFDCSSIVTVYLTEEINVIEKEAFRKCSKLQNIILLNVTEIKNSAFIYCTGLKNISLPPMLTVIEQSAFGFCSSLTVDASQNTNFEIIEGMFFIDQKKTLSDYFGENTTITIPSFCTKIGKSAFASKSVKNITFDSPTTLELLSYAFDSSKLEEIALPSCLSSIGGYCFNNCNNLRKITFDDCPLSSIPIKCFYSCKVLDDINIPSNIISIGESAFSLCTALKKLDLTNTKLKQLDYLAFSESGVKKLEFPSTTTTIGDNSFEKSSLETVDLSKTSLSIIPTSCFSECSMLTTVILGGETSTIDILAFYKCIRLNAITLPVKIYTIESHAFEGCSALQSFTLTPNCMLNTIKARAFANCPSLVLINIDPNDEMFIFEKGALLSKNRVSLKFFLPSSKTSVFVVPSAVKTISTSAFEDCTNLRMVIFPDNGTYNIEYRAFAGCTQLNYVYLPNSLTNIGDQAFDGCKRLKCGSIYASNSETIKELLRNIKIDPIIYSSSCSSIRTLQKCTKSSFSPIPIVLMIIYQ